MTDVVLVMRGVSVRCSSEADAREFLCALTGCGSAPSAAAPPARVRRVSARVQAVVDTTSRVYGAVTHPDSVSRVETCDAVEPASASASVIHTVLSPEPAEPSASAQAAFTRALTTELREEIYGSDALSRLKLPRIITPAKRRGRPPRASSPSVDDVEADHPAPRPSARSITDSIIAAFAFEESPNFPELARRVFGHQDANAIRKLKLALEQLVVVKRLVRLGVASFRPSTDETDEDEDEDREEQGEDADSFDPSEERPASFNEPIPEVDIDF